MRVLLGLLMVAVGFLLGALGVVILFVGFADSGPTGTEDRVFGVVTVIIGVSLYRSGQGRLPSPNAVPDGHTDAEPGSTSTSPSGRTAPAEQKPGLGAKFAYDVTVGVVVSAVTAMAGALLGG